MSDFDSNPFADPEAANPFSDPSVRQATNTQRPGGGLDNYNPFSESNKTQPTRPATGPPPPQPAVMQPTEEPPPYQPSAAQSATDDLKRRQEELERKAAELQRKEQEMNRLQAQGGVRANNFPPLPAKCPIQPCFYQDFSVDIPMEFQRIVKIIYYVWMFHSVTLFLNVVGALAYFCVMSTTDGSSGLTFGLSIVYFLLFTPCSFVCWYRPVYKAFRSDSSFNFFVFFFIYFFQFVVHVLQSIGIPSWGTCGWLVAFQTVSKDGSGPKGVGAFMLFIAAFFTINAVASIILLIKVHRIYRSTGASFEKAQAEFSQGVWTNKTVQNAAGNAAAATARAATQNAMSDNKY